MKKICIYLMINCLWLQPLLAQHLNQVITDTTLLTEVLIDTCDRDGLSGPVFGAFYQQEYATYSPDSEIIQQIDQQLNNYHLTIVMGSWCSDSQEQVPRIYKILDQLHFPGNQVTLICVDRKRKPSMPTFSVWISSLSRPLFLTKAVRKQAVSLKHPPKPSKKTSLVSFKPRIKIK